MCGTLAVTIEIFFPTIILIHYYYCLVVVLLVSVSLQTEAVIITRGIFVVVPHWYF